MPATTSPDFAGFSAAQKRLRAEFGHDLTFYIPQARTWPAGVQLDPERGEPYDPTVVPATGGGLDEVVVRVSVAQRETGQSRIGLRDQSVQSALGRLTAGGLLMIVDIDDFHLIRNATEVDYAEDRYVIREKVHDYLGQADRYLFFGQRDGGGT